METWFIHSEKKRHKQLTCHRISCLRTFTTRLHQKHMHRISELGEGLDARVIHASRQHADRWTVGGADLAHTRVSAGGRPNFISLFRASCAQISRKFHAKLFYRFLSTLSLKARNCSKIPARAHRVRAECLKEPRPPSGLCTCRSALFHDNSHCMAGRLADPRWSFGRHDGGYAVRGCDAATG